MKLDRYFTDRRRRGIGASPRSARFLRSNRFLRFPRHPVFPIFPARMKSGSRAGRSLEVVSLARCAGAVAGPVIGPVRDPVVAVGARPRRSRLGRTAIRIREGGSAAARPPVASAGDGPSGELPGRESSMGSTRRRSDRPDSARRRPGSTPRSAGEPSAALRRGSGLPFAATCPSDLLRHQPDHRTSGSRPRSAQPDQHNNPNSPLLSNQGKIVSGKDRQGDEWTITVHGPG